MSKRFTDTNKYKKTFIRELPGAYKLLWDYLYHDCDHAGIWIVDFAIAQIYLGMDMPVTRVEALKQFNKDEVRIVEFDDGKKWFIKPFVEFQYGELNQNNRVHSSIIGILNKYNLLDNQFKPLTSPLQGAKDKVKDKDTGNGNILKGDFLDEIITAYVDASGGDYLVVNRGKERTAAGKLLNIYKKKYPEATSEETLQSLTAYFRACIAIPDTWLSNNMSLTIIISKFNEINKILKNGSKRKTGNGNGATDEELATIIAKNFGTDYKP